MSARAISPGTTDGSGAWDLRGDQLPSQGQSVLQLPLRTATRWEKKFGKRKPGLATSATAKPSSSPTMTATGTQIGSLKKSAERSTPATEKLTVKVHGSAGEQAEP